MLNSKNKVGYQSQEYQQKYTQQKVAELEAKIGVCQAKIAISEQALVDSEQQGNVLAQNLHRAEINKENATIDKHRCKIYLLIGQMKQNSLLSMTNEELTPETDKYNSFLDSDNKQNDFNAVRPSRAHGPEKFNLLIDQLKQTGLPKLEAKLNSMTDTDEPAAASSSQSGPVDNGNVDNALSKFGSFWSPASQEGFDNSSASPNNTLQRK